jgi:hypothetical protein
VLRVKVRSHVDLYASMSLDTWNHDKRGAKLLFRVLAESDEKASVAVASNESYFARGRCRPSDLGSNILETRADSYRPATTRAVRTGR